MLLTLVINVFGANILYSSLHLILNILLLSSFNVLISLIYMLSNFSNCKGESLNIFYIINQFFFKLNCIKKILANNQNINRVNYKCINCIYYHNNRSNHHNRRIISHYLHNHPHNLHNLHYNIEHDDNHLIHHNAL
jgi:hypothetical protein